MIASAIGDVLNVDQHVARGYLLNDQDKVLESEALANVYNVIAVEIMRAINYYTYENQNNTLEKLYVYGGGSHIRSLVASIADSQSSLQVVLVDAMDPNAPKELEDQLTSFGIAGGGGIMADKSILKKEIHPVKVHYPSKKVMNFVHDEQAKADRHAIVIFIIFLMFLALLTKLFVINPLNKVNQLESNYNQMAARCSSIRKR